MKTVNSLAPLFAIVLVLVATTLTVVGAEFFNAMVGSFAPTSVRNGGDLILNCTHKVDAQDRSHARDTLLIRLTKDGEEFYRYQSKKFNVSSVKGIHKEDILAFSDTPGRVVIKNAGKQTAGQYACSINGDSADVKHASMSSVSVMVVDSADGRDHHKEKKEKKKHKKNGGNGARAVFTVVVVLMIFSALNAGI